MSTTFLVNEIYPCLQGEGINLGKPSILLRFQICNLRCVWCDTSYTHTFKSDPIEKNNLKSEQKFYRINLDFLIEKICSFKEKHIIFTGGEPTLQNIGIIARRLKKKSTNYTFEVESNGTKIPHKSIKDFLKTDYKLMQWNISPKFGSSGENVNPESLIFWSKLAKTKSTNVFFKFVIGEKTQEKELQEIRSMEKAFSLPKKSIILMPEGTTLESQIGNIWLTEICLENGYRYTPRLHVLTYGSKRGV